MKISVKFFTWIAPIVAVLFFYSMANADFSNDGKKKDCESQYGIQNLPEKYDRSEIDRVEPLTWSEVNPERIDKNQTVPVSVNGGVPPFFWNVDEPYFSLNSETTIDRQNLISATASVCGSASITVTDANGNQVNGYLRSWNGVWVIVKIDNSCNWDWNTGVLCETIEGKTWTVVSAAGSRAHAPCTPECIHFYCVYNPCDYCHFCGTQWEEHWHITSTGRATIYEWQCPP